MNHLFIMKCTAEPYERKIRSALAYLLCLIQSFSLINDFQILKIFTTKILQICFYICLHQLLLQRWEGCRMMLMQSFLNCFEKFHKICWHDGKLFICDKKLCKKLFKLNKALGRISHQPSEKLQCFNSHKVSVFDSERKKFPSGKA